MHSAATKLIGTHDFRNFCKMDISNGVVNYIRHVKNAEVHYSELNNKFNKPEYDICEFTLVGNAFLYHQVRCVVSILFLIGQGVEDEDVLHKLFDVEKYPRKPQYAMSDSLPLVLFECEFEGLDWYIEPNTISNVISTLEEYWLSNEIKSTIVSRMLTGLGGIISQRTNSVNLCNSLFNDSNKKRLLERETGRSLEDGIEHYVKKGRLQLQNKSSKVLMEVNQSATDESEHNQMKILSDESSHIAVNQAEDQQ